AERLLREPLITAGSVDAVDAARKAVPHPQASVLRVVREPAYVPREQPAARVLDDDAVRAETAEPEVSRPDVGATVGQAGDCEDEVRWLLLGHRRRVSHTGSVRIARHRARGIRPAVDSIRRVARRIGAGGRRPGLGAALRVDIGRDEAVVPASVRELRSDAAVMQFGRSIDSAEPDVASSRIERDAAIVGSDEGDTSAGADSVERRMPVLDEPGASDLTVALRVAGVIRVPQGEAVVAAKPDVLRLRVPDDSMDGAQLLATSWLGWNDARPAEDVVVDDVQLARSVQRHAIGVAALVDRRIRTLPVPVVLATVRLVVPASLVPHEDRIRRATGD